MYLTINAEAYVLDADWNSLFNSVALEEVRNRLENPSDAALNEFEEQSTFNLPVSYRAYIKTFGPGRLAGEYVIRAPGYHVEGLSNTIHSFNYQVDLRDLNLMLRQSGPLQVVHANRYSDWDRLIRIVYFADNSAGDYVGWDPKDESDASGHEYRIYVLEREASESRRLADTFSDFVSQSCFGQVGQFVPPRTFRPASRFYLR